MAERWCNATLKPSYVAFSLVANFSPPEKMKWKKTKPRTWFAHACTARRKKWTGREQRRKKSKKQDCPSHADQARSRIQTVLFSGNSPFTGLWSLLHLVLFQWPHSRCLRLFALQKIMTSSNYHLLFFKSLSLFKRTKVSKPFTSFLRSVQSNTKYVMVSTARRNWYETRTVTFLKES